MAGRSHKIDSSILAFYFLSVVSMELCFPMLQGSRKIEFIGGHNLTFVDLESLTKIENKILADYQGRSRLL